MHTVKSLLTPKEILEHSIRTNKKMEIERQRSLLEQEETEKSKYKVIEEIQNIKNKAEQNRNKYYTFTENVKVSLLSEALFMLFDRSINESVNNTIDLNIRHNYVNNFIKENGVNTLLREFKTKTPFLSNISNTITKYHGIIVEKADKDDPTTFVIDKEDKDKFFEEIDNKEVEKVIDIVNTRVADAINQFIEDNKADREKIENIINTTQEKIDSAKNDKIAESFDLMRKRGIKNVRNSRYQTVFENMVFAISKESMKNEVLKEQFSTNGKIDINLVVETAKVMYTFLELANTTKMINVDEKYIRSVYNQLNA